MTVLLNSTNVTLKESLKIDQGIDLNNSLSSIKTKIKQASGIVSSYPAGASPTYTTSATQLILDLPSIDSSNQVITNAYDVFVFFQNNNLLRLKSFPDPQSSIKSADQVLSNKIDSINFKYFDNSNPPLEVSPTVALKIRATLSFKQQHGIYFETSIGTAEADLRN